MYLNQKGLVCLIEKLKPGKAPGPDGIAKRDLILDINVAASCLAKIFNASLKSGELPTDWTTANVVPVFKGGDSLAPDNYRPISLTSIPCKMLEHIILRELNSTIQDMTPAQHGFRKNLSCETQLCRTYQQIAMTWDKGLTTHALILDFKKAFDKVPHQLLMKKLATVGVQDHLLRWIHGFLSSRTQRVLVGGKASDIMSVTSGVPQGSVLGPALFSIYVNDIPDCVDCHVSMFADDTLMYQAIRSDGDRDQFQRNIDSIELWAKQWGMQFNVAKCHCMSFSPSKGGNEPDYALGTVPIRVCTSAKYLGVIIQSDLKFNLHIDGKIKKASQALGMLRRVLSDAPTDCKKLAYTSLVRPHLEYASQVWDPYNRGTVHQIEMAQNRALRFILRMRGRESITEARMVTRLDTLEDRRRMHRLSLMRCIETNPDLHPEMTEMMSRSRSGTRSTTTGKPLSLSANTDIYKNSFLPRTIRDMRKE